MYSGSALDVQIFGEMGGTHENKHRGGADTRACAHLAFRSIEDPRASYLVAVTTLGGLAREARCGVGQLRSARAAAARAA